MAITSGQLTVGTTAVQVDGNSTGWAHIHIKNLDNTDHLYIGGSDLTLANGYHVDKQEFIEFDIPPGEAVYLLASTGTIAVAWMRISA
jgi:hypothetical protein